SPGHHRHLHSFPTRRSSDLHTATWADQICMIRSMHTEAFNHHPATIMMNTGFARMGRPTIGSWLTYGLGNESENLPGYIVLEPRSEEHTSELQSQSNLVCRL